MKWSNKNWENKFLSLAVEIEVKHKCNCYNPNNYCRIPVIIRHRADFDLRPGKSRVCPSIEGLDVGKGSASTLNQ